MKQHRDLAQFEWCAGQPFLDFLNTANNRNPKGSEGDYLSSYEQWVAWCLLGNLIPLSVSQSLMDLANEKGELAKLAWQRVIRFRNLGARMVLAVLNARQLATSDCKSWREWVQDSLAFREFEIEPSRCRWTVKAPGEQLDDLLWIMVEYAEAFFENPGGSRLKDCPTPEGCGWFFQDQSKNNSRRWCNMKTCGNTAKVNRFNAKKRQAP